jgi:hypothetical protein
VNDTILIQGDPGDPIPIPIPILNKGREKESSQNDVPLILVVLVSRSIATTTVFRINECVAIAITFPSALSTFTS